MHKTQFALQLLLVFVTPLHLVSNCIINYIFLSRHKLHLTGIYRTITDNYAQPDAVPLATSIAANQTTGVQHMVKIPYPNIALRQASIAYIVKRLGLGELELIWLINGKHTLGYQMDAHNCDINTVLGAQNMLTVAHAADAAIVLMDKADNFDSGQTQNKEVYAEALARLMLPQWQNPCATLKAQLIAQAHQRAVSLVLQNQNEIRLLADLILSRECLEQDELKLIMH